jgi:putative DNA primase/helicase
MKPEVDEFCRFYDLLTEAAPDDYTPWLFRVRSGDKAPATQFGSWKDESARLDLDAAVEWMEEGGNIGIAGTADDELVNVDIDDEDETDIDDLKPTLIGRSRSRTGVHAWYFAAEEIPNIPTDTAGEVRTSWQYVVAPGSYVETDPEVLSLLISFWLWVTVLFVAG